MDQDDQIKTKGTSKQEWMDFDAELEAQGIHVQSYAEEEKALREQHPEEIPVIKTSGAVKSQIIETVRAKEELGIDALTGAMNLRRYREETERLQTEASRNHHERRTDPEIVIKDPFSIIKLDVDYFKDINDEYGHGAGDMVLQELARRIQERVRLQSGDLFARVGGEEFCVVILAANGYAPEVAEQLRQIVEKEPFRIINNKGVEKFINVTISLGVSPYETSTEIMERHADSALYKAKGKGREGQPNRNQVWVWARGEEQAVLYRPRNRQELAA